MAHRYDFVQVSNPRIDSKTGILRCRGTIARIGVQDYRDVDGSIRREFRPPDEVEKSAKSFETQPITLDHPPEMVNASNSRQYMRGLSGVVQFDGALLSTELTVTDEEAVEAAQTTHRQLSNGYDCDIDYTPGVWENQPYDCIQRNIRGNHIALVERARAGDVAKLHLDSANDFRQDSAIAVRLDQKEFEIPLNCVLDSSLGNTEQQNCLTKSPSTHRPRMATLRIDSVDFPDVPEALAAQMSNKLQQLAAQTTRADSAETTLATTNKRVQELEDLLEEATDSRERERGRADQLEIQVEDLTYQIESAPEVKTDSAEESGARLDEDEILAHIATGIQEGLAARIEAYDLLEQHGIDLSEIEIGNDLTPTEVQEGVLSLIHPQATFDSVEDNVRHIYIAARYDALKTTAPIVEETRLDAEGFVSQSKSMITQNRKQAGKKGGKEEVDEGCQTKMDAHTRPLSMSKRGR